MKLGDKLKDLTNAELLQLSDELKKTEVAEDALIRLVIKGTEYDTNIPVLAFVAVGQCLQFELADRLRIMFNIK